MKIRNKFWKNIFLLDLGFLFFGIFISLFIQNYGFRQNAELFSNTIRNDLLISDQRSINSKILAAVKQNQFISIQIDNKLFPPRERSLIEFNFWDIKFVNSILANTTEQDTIIGKIEFTYSIWPALLLVFIVWLFLNLILITLIPMLKRHLEIQIQEEQEKIRFKRETNLAKQVAHDIRSPLAALNMAMELISDSSENELNIIRNAIQRINDIANNLLQKSRDQLEPSFIENDSTCNTLPTEFLPHIIDTLVSEKRMQYREFIDLNIEIDLKDSFSAFSQVNISELTRIISNLINNSIESFNNYNGNVTVIVLTNTSNNQNEITVKDNGKGIPSHFLDKLGTSGFTHGKKNSAQSGNGLGLHHAFQTAKKFGGFLKIESTEECGTAVTLCLPLAIPPNWFAQKLDLKNKNLLISLDDDTSIHQIWAKRIQLLNNDKIRHEKFQSGDVFKDFTRTHLTDINQTLFLIDYELLNQHKNGLDLISELKIGRCSILVTSRYEDEEIKLNALRLGIQILPKSLAGFIPIETDEQKNKYDIILIDDDSLVRMTWEHVAKKNNKSILCLSTSNQLWEILEKLDYSCTFYIDLNLSENDNGELVSKKLFDKGFLNLYLATGYEADQLKHITWVKGVVGKKPPL